VIRNKSDLLIIFLLYKCAKNLTERELKHLDAGIEEINVKGTSSIGAFCRMS